MTCKTCKLKPVIKLTNNNIELCKSCFIKYFEIKVKKTIRIHKLIDKKDHIGVALSGGKDSLTTLNILDKICKKRNIKLTALLINEGTKNYRDEIIKIAKQFCKEKDIPLNIYTFKKEFKKTLPEMKRHHPCSTCGVLRRQLLNKYAKKLKITKLATGHNLDDEAQTVLMNFFRRNIKTSARLGPLTGIINTTLFIKRIKPLYMVKEEEVELYAKLKGFLHKYKECPFHKTSYRSKVRKMLNNFEKQFPGTKHNIIKSFLEILPTLKKEYKTKDQIKQCKICKEPCSQEICQACQILKEI